MRAKRMVGVEDENWTEIDKLHLGTKLISLMIESTGLIERASRNGTHIITGTEEAIYWIQHHYA